jgi:hypothetical protein
MAGEGIRTKQVLDGTDTVADGVWWTKSEKDIGPAMVQVAKQYEAALEPRREQSRRYVQLYKGQLLAQSMFDAGFARGPFDARLCWNIVQAGINTAASVVTRNRVRVTFETTGGDYELQQAAKLAELFVQGVFAGNKLYEELDPLWFLDAAAPGLGMLLVEPDEDGSAVTIERTIPDELIYNEAEALRGSRHLQQLFTVQWMSKWAAVAKFATTYDADGKATVDQKKVAAIRACQAYQMPLAGVPDKHIPLIPIYRGWFLPSRRGGDDGKRVVAVPGENEGATLSVRPWKWSRFPFAFFRTEMSPAGLWGISIAERLEGFQDRLNELNYEIEEAARLGSVGKWLVETGSNVNDAELNNEHAGIVKYTTKAPEFVNLDGIPKDLLNERDKTYQQALREIGLSEWTVGGTQPENIESGEGLRQLREQEQGRAIPAGQQWEGAHVELAELVVMAAVDAFEKNNKLAVNVIDPDGDGLARVEFAKIAKLLQDPDAWQARPYPTSILPQMPAAKFEKLREWRADGTIDQATFEALSDMPDLQQESSLILAGVKAVRHSVGEIVKRGAKGYEPPDPAMPLQLALKIAQATYLRGLRTGMPDDKLSLLLTWIDDCRALAGLQAPPLGMPQPPPEGAPPGAAPPPADMPPPAPAPEGAAAPPLATAPGIGMEPAAAGPVAPL